MRRLLLVIVLLALVVAPAAAEGPRFSGYVWKGHGDTARFTVRPASELESWWFLIPSNTYFWCKVFDEDGVEKDDIDLSDHQSITLLNALGKKVQFAVYEINGSGAWSAWRYSSRSSANEDVDLGGTTSHDEAADDAGSGPEFTYSGSSSYDEPSEESPSAGSSSDEGSSPDVIPMYGGIAQGYLNEDQENSFDYYSASDTDYVRFTVPDDVSFWVKVYNDDGSLLGDFDLSDGNSIGLVATGTFRFTIYSVSGEGEWRANRDKE